MTAPGPEIGQTTGPAPAEDAVRLESISAELAGVETALRSMDDGGYGTCQVCGAPLPPAELEADPLITRCTTHPA